MSTVFADTSYYFALLNEDDAYHAAAVEAAQAASLRIVTTGFVLMELGNAASRRASRAGFVSFVETLRDDARTRIVDVSMSLFDGGLALFAERPDKDWSLVDCTSFVAMRRLRIRDAFTTDRHFTQAGFRTPLLRRAP